MMLNGGALNTAPLNALLDSGGAPAPATAPQAVSALYYVARITGAEDAIADYEFSIVTFQATRRTARNSYYNVVAPYSEDLAAALAARPNGRIAVDSWPIYTDGSVGPVTEYEIFNVDSARPSVGALTASLVLVGYRQYTWPTSALLALDDSGLTGWRIDSDGRWNFDVTQDFAAVVNPGDRVDYDGNEILIDEIQISAGAGRFSARLVSVAP